MTVSRCLPGTDPWGQIDLPADFSELHTNGGRIGTSTIPGKNYFMGIRFLGIPSEMENFRGARMQLTPLYNYHEHYHFSIKGHLSTNSPAFWWTDRPDQRWNLESTSQVLHVNLDGLTSATAVEMPDPDGILFEMVEAMLAVPGRVEGSALSFMFRAFTDTTYDARIQPGASGLLVEPALLLRHGPLAIDAPRWQQVDLGDSWAAYLCHDGFEIGALPVIFMGSTTVGKAAAGMQYSSAISFYGGDSFRGYETPATIERIFIDELGEDTFDMNRKEFAVAGSTMGQWQADTHDPSSGRWGPPEGGGSLRWVLANPDQNWQLVWVSAGGNDFHGVGGQTRLNDVYDQLAVDAQWDDAVEILRPLLFEIIDEIYAYADELHTWIVLPGYGNFCVKRSNQAGQIILPNSGSYGSYGNDIFRAVYSLNISIGGCQFLWDSIGYSAIGEIHNPVETLVNQSALVRAASVWQAANHPEESIPGYAFNPSGAWWNYALTQVGFPLPLGPLQYQGWNFAGVDRWLESYRNVHDISVNQRFRMLDDIYRDVASSYPRVIFLPSPQSMGIDTTFSVNPASEFAQSHPDKWVEGIHPNKDGFKDWIVNDDPNGTPSIFRRLLWNIPFLQKFSTDIYKSWDGDTLSDAKMRGEYDGVEFTPAHIEWPLTLADY